MMSLEDNQTIVSHVAVIFYRDNPPSQTFTASIYSSKLLEEYINHT